ncbi:MAG TPA: PIN domain-containing protein [Saprospiraceae bacterium]|nr:PIN domain-containing protein [Saprospiraceae bacterium]
MKAILDANIIISDFRLTSPDSKILLEAAKNKNIELFIPEIVLDEIFNKFTERLLDAKSKIDKEKNIIKKLTNLDLIDEFSLDQIENIAQEYKKYIIKIFDDNNVKILNYPSVTHKEIVQKAIKKLKPFNSSEKGYRDSLIWENVKDLMPNLGTNIANPEVIFVTNNKKDFCENENDLHRELITEIKDAELDLDSIKVINSLNEFSRDIVQLFFIQATSFKSRLEAGEIEGFNLEYFILLNIKKELENNEISDIDSIPYRYEDATVRYIENVKNVKINDVRKMNASEYHLDLTCYAEMTIDFYVDKYDYYSNDEITFDVEDLDWNDYVIWASKLINPELKISIIIDNNLNLISIQID